VETLWKRYQANYPAIKLTDSIKKTEPSELIANEAVKFARDKGLRPADSIHAASAIKK
jgi:hypothetical protein